MLCGVLLLLVDRDVLQNAANKKSAIIQSLKKHKVHAMTSESLTFWRENVNRQVMTIAGYHLGTRWTAAEARSTT